MAQRGKLNSVIILFIDFLFYLLFTNRCEYCGEIIKYGQTVCDDCKQNLPKIKGEKCIYCGCGKEKCSCKNAKMRYDGISAPFYYEGGIERSIKYFKFDGKSYVAEVLALDLAESVRKDFENIKFDFIDFVPFSKIQRRNRDFNPAGEIAKNLSKYIDVPVKQVLAKPFETDIQHVKGASWRNGNVAGAFDIKRNADVNGKTILLVDDIKTTGATLSECARVLKIAGAKSVYCAVVAVTNNQKSK